MKLSKIWLIAELIKAYLKRLKYSGIDMEDWLHGFDDVTDSVKMSVDQLETIL